MRRDCPICKSEGFEALNRIRVSSKNGTLVASLIVMDNPKIPGQDEVGLSKDAVISLQAKDGDRINLSHLETVDSMRFDKFSSIMGNKNLLRLLVYYQSLLTLNYII